MKFRFAFENVLRHRKTLEDLAQRDFQQAQAELFQEIQNLEQMKQEVNVAREVAFEKTIEGGRAGSALRQIDEFLGGQDIRIERQQKKIQECEKRVEELREILRQRAVDYKIIESLRERKREEFLVEERKREQRAEDDLNIMRFRQKEEKT